MKNDGVLTSSSVNTVRLLTAGKESKADKWVVLAASAWASAENRGACSLVLVML